MTSTPRIAMVAGETSGDLLAGLLLDGLRGLWPGLQACGIGGPQMARRGFEAWWPSERLAVHGYSIEVFRRLAGIMAIRRQLRQRLLQDRPDVFIGVDAPDFNLGLEADLRAAMERGDRKAAIGYWEALLPQVEPGSEIDQMLRSGIDKMKAAQ